MPYLSKMPWREAEEYFASNDCVLFPIGCMHAHDHIPLGIDQHAAEYISREVEKRTDLMVVPTLPFGWMPQYMDYPGTITLQSKTFMDVILEVALCLYKWGVRRILFINGHGGNTAYLNDIGCQLREKGMLTPIFDWWRLIKSIDPKVAEQAAEVPGAVVGRPSKTRGVETAVAMAILPDSMPPESLRVIKSKELFGDGFTTNFFSGVVFRGVQVPMPLLTFESSEYGVVGTNATQELGQVILEQVIDFIVGFVQEFKRHPIP